MRIAATLAFSACLAATSAAAQDFSKVEMKTEAVGPGIYMIAGGGGNLGLSVGDDAIFLIDDQYAPLTPKIQAAIAAITPRPVKFILNTHWHGDHTGGNENFGKAGAVIIAQDNVRKRMSTEQFVEAWKITIKAQPPGALPVITFSADTTFHINGDEVHAFHVPRAHTDGDVLVHFRRADVIHMGDVYFNGMYPFIDGSSGGTVDGVIAAVDRALALATDKTRIIPGHGPLSNKAELKAYRDMLSTVAGRVKQMLKEGRKLEEITASTVTADFDGKWGKGFIKPNKFAEMMAMNYIRNAP